MAEQSSGIHIGLTKIFQLWKKSHGKDFLKTSLNAREKLFSKSIDKKSVWPYELLKLAKKYKKEYQIVMN